MVASFENLIELLERSVEAFAARPLFGTKRNGRWEWTSYGSFHDLVARCRAALAAAGVKSGDKVAIISNNRVEWATVAHAAYALGAVVVPMYEAQHAAEREFILSDCRAKVVFAANEMIAAEVRGARARLPSLERVLVFDAAADDPDAFSAWLERGPVSAPPPLEVPAEATAALVYTSGTTGAPKGVVLSHGNLVSNVRALNQVFPFDPDDRSLSFLPWAHAFGLAEQNALMSMGCSLALSPDPRQLVEQLGEVRPTILVAVPRVFNRLHRAIQEQLGGQPRFLRTLYAAAIRAAARRSGEAGGRPSLLDALSLRVIDRLVFARVRERLGGRLKYAICGSAALGEETARFMDAVGIAIYEGYGLTETSPIVSANTREHRRLGSVGKVVPGVRVVIDGASSGGDGEIVVYGPNVMSGYHQRPAETAAAFRPDGGLHTGDLGHFDADGYLYVSGRIKEQFKLENGKFVVPSGLEEAIKLSRYIANALVYGDNKPYTVALVVLDPEPIVRWAKEQDIEVVDPARDANVRALIEREIRERSEGFKEYERTRAFAFVEDFSTENGLLTPTLKVRRDHVVRKYQGLLASLYAGGEGSSVMRSSSARSGESPS